MPTSKNLAVPVTIEQEGVNWLNVFDDVFLLYGLYQPLELRRFIRLPDDIATATNEGVQGLYRHTSGGRVCFRTDSPYVAINAALHAGDISTNMPVSATHGFDLYSDNEYYGTFCPAIDKLGGFDSIIRFHDRRAREITIYFPIYGGVSSLYIGLGDGSVVEKSVPYPQTKPILFYGSSITQGGCASRPGNAYPAIISRELNRDFINLGFAGSARGEKVIVDYMSDMEISLFVCDYDHNAPTPEHLEATYPYIYESFRDKHPYLPIIYVTKPDIYIWRPDDIRRRDAIYRQYSNAIDGGDRHIYFIDGQSLFGGKGRLECTVDTCHPNDLGFYRMADVIGTVIKNIVY